jgi:hypothetical protein
MITGGYIRQYRVRASYYPGLEMCAYVEAPTERASVIKAILQQKLPTWFLRGTPRFWESEDGWPVLVDDVVSVGGKDSMHSFEVSVERIG